MGRDSKERSVRQGSGGRVDESEGDQKGPRQIQIAGTSGSPHQSYPTPCMQRLATSSLRLPLSRPNFRPENPKLILLTILRHSSESKSGLSRSRLMKSQPSPTTSTEAPTRIPKATNAAQADVFVGEATKTTLAATQVQHGSPSQSSEEILYERKPSWWIKWVWVLIGMDIIWS